MSVVVAGADGKAYKGAKRVLALLRGPVRESTQHLNDEQVVMLVQKGAIDDFRVLIERHQHGIYSMVMRQVGDAPTAEELTHEIFIKAYTGLRSFGGRSKFSSWLIRIAINHTHTFFRSKRFNQLKRSESFSLEKHDHHAEDIASDCQDGALERFRQALAQLKPKLREVLILCGLEGKSYEQASEILNIPVGTVRSRLHTARTQIKNACAGES